MNEHRKNERKKIIAFTPVYDANKTKLLGYLGDLSMQGALLIGETPLELNTQITLVIDFPETAEFSARQMKLPCRIAWRKQEGNTPYFNTGVEFQKVNEMYKPFLEAILERYQFRREAGGINQP
ncbi:MAG TPA: PilZ domain-containing protein [Anaerolineales bacterium]|nr:PilZ domain-containing protein [Anaerolineales bacterium]